MTIGVEHRVEVLADRSEAQAGRRQPPEKCRTWCRCRKFSPTRRQRSASQKSSATTIRRSASSAPSLRSCRRSRSRTSPAPAPRCWPRRSRACAGEVICDPGCDGEYGVIRLFEDSELKRLTAGAVLFDAPATKRTKAAVAKPKTVPERSATMTLPGRAAAAPPRPRPGRQRGFRRPAQLDDDQRAAAAAAGRPAADRRRPGIGQDPHPHSSDRPSDRRARRGRTNLSRHHVHPPRRRRDEGAARAPARQRCRSGCHPHLPSLGLAILREHAGAVGLQRGFRIAGEAERVVALAEALGVTEPKAERLLRAISKAKRSPGAASADVAEAMSAYGQALALRNWIDFDDLVALDSRPDRRRRSRGTLPRSLPMDRGRRVPGRRRATIPPAHLAGARQ